VPAESHGWRGLELGAPRLAELGLACLTARKVALLGTLRRDGSPRISPVEPCFAGGQLLIGAMPWSQKCADLRRDPRYVLHSGVAGPDEGEPEFSLHGVAAEAAADLAGAAAGAWWQDQPPGTAVVFSLGADLAVYVSWDLGRGLLTVDRWSARDGYRQATRRYP
jgi:hypothetical protein